MYYLTEMFLWFNRSEFKRVSYEGFYTMVLEKNGEIISAALLRFGFRDFLCLCPLVDHCKIFFYLCKFTWINLEKPVVQ